MILMYFFFLLKPVRSTLFQDLESARMDATAKSERQQQQVNAANEALKEAQKKYDDMELQVHKKGGGRR